MGYMRFVISVIFFELGLIFGWARARTIVLKWFVYRPEESYVPTPSRVPPRPAQVRVHGANITHDVPWTSSVHPDHAAWWLSTQMGRHA